MASMSAYWAWSATIWPATAAVTYDRAGLGWSDRGRWALLPGIRSYPGRETSAGDATLTS